MTEPTPDAPVEETPIVNPNPIPASVILTEPPTEDDVNTHANEDGDLIAEYKERVTEILDNAQAAVEKVRQVLAEAEAGGLHVVHEAFAELRSVVKDLVPSQTLLKTPSPSIDPNHPQGLGRVRQPGESQPTGVV